MYEYTHGGNIRYKNPHIIDFSANVNPLGLPPDVRGVVNAVDFSAYPDHSATALRCSIANFENVEPEHIICGNGASDLIFRLAFTIKPNRALVTAPTFSDYARAINAAGGEVVHYPLSEGNGFALDDDVLDFIENTQIDMVFLCNPNNPTGCLTSFDLIARIVSLCNSRGVIVVVDECFIDFVPDNLLYTAKPLLKEFPGIVILKAFTKVFAMAGLRLGYALCSDIELIQRLHFHGADWSVSVIAQAAGIAALNNPGDYLRKTVTYVEEEKKRILKTLQQADFEMFGSKANYIFFKNPHDIDFGAELLKYGIYIRSCANYHTLDSRYYRTAVLRSEQNDVLMQAITKIIVGDTNG